MKTIKNIISFYIEGFRSMTLGKSLWLMIILKVVFLIVLMKFLFFPNFLNSNFDSDEERSSYVRHTLATPDNNNN